MYQWGLCLWLHVSASAWDLVHAAYRAPLHEVCSHFLFQLWSGSSNSEPLAAWMNFQPSSNDKTVSKHQHQTWNSACKSLSNCISFFCFLLCMNLKLQPLNSDTWRHPCIQDCDTHKPGNNSMSFFATAPPDEAGFSCFLFPEFFSKLFLVFSLSSESTSYGTNCWQAQPIHCYSIQGKTTWSQAPAALPSRIHELYVICSCAWARK